MGTLLPILCSLGELGPLAPQALDTADIGMVLDEEGGYGVVLGWSTQAFDGTTRGTAGSAGLLAFGSG